MLERVNKYKLNHAYPGKIEVAYGKLVSKLEAVAKGNFLMEKPEIEVIMGLALYCGTSDIRDINCKICRLL